MDIEFVAVESDIKKDVCNWNGENDNYYVYMNQEKKKKILRNQEIKVIEKIWNENVFEFSFHFQIP